MTTFKEEELAGWNARAGTYGGYAGQVTAQIAPRLLDAAGVRAGTRLLDIACGPGYTAAAAMARQAKVVGIDFAPSMLAEARRAYPEIEFRHGDAEALDFADGAFDAVTCAFGMGHFAQPDKAIAEARRVLRGAARYAFCWWRSDESHEFYTLFHEAVSKHGDMNVPMPEAPPFTRFSDPDECRRSLTAAGFVEVRAEEHGLVYEVPTARHVVDFIHKSAVRSAMLLERQASEARARIEEALERGAQKFRRGDVFRFAWPAIVASGTKR